MEQKPSCCKKNVKAIEGNLERRKEKVWEALEMEDQTLWTINSSGVYNRDPLSKGSLPGVAFGYGDLFLKDRGDLGHNALTG